MFYYVFWFGMLVVLGFKTAASEHPLTQFYPIAATTLR